MCKLDLEKTYDHVNWDFLLSILKQLGFGERWLKWIVFALKLSSFSSGKWRTCRFSFPSEMSLRQGDPLSPFLFIITMEGFNNMMRLTIQKRWLKGFNLNNMAGLEICHLLYANDIVIFCEDKTEQISFIRVLLLTFEASLKLEEKEPSSGSDAGTG